MGECHVHFNVMSGDLQDVAQLSATLRQLRAMRT
jgi:hypothetical protein